MEQIKSWDEAAADYQRVFRMGLNDYNRQLLEFFTSNGLLHPGCRVLDIGCGVGKYGTYFAELGCGVTLTDISPAMLAHAARNMAAYATPWRIVEGAYSHHPRLGAYADLRAFFDASPDEQRRRILARDGAAAWESFAARWIPMEERYLAAFAVREHAHVVVAAGG